MRRFPASSRFRYRLHMAAVIGAWIFNGSCAVLALLIYAGVQ